MDASLNPVSRRAVPDGLLRVLGVPESAAIVVGTLIGTGIFLVPAEMVGEVHTLGWILLVWVVGGLLSLFGALSYAELGVLRPEAGGEYAYLRDGLGPLFGFLFGWGMFWIIRPVSVATIGAGFARAATALWPQLTVGLLHVPGLGEVNGQQALAAAVILLVTGIDYFGVRHGGRVQVWFTALKLLLLVGLTTAAFTVGKGDWGHFAQRLPGHITVAGFTAALVAALWAYDGWNDLTLAGSEIRDPERTIPRSMILGVLVVFLFYAGINLAYFYVLTPGEVHAAGNVAAAMAARFMGRNAGRLVAWAVMVSAFATLNSSILSGARVPFAMARDRLFFKRLARVHSRHHTPHVSLLVQAMFAVLLVGLLGSFQRLYSMTIFAEWLFYTLAITSLFAFRLRGERSPYRSWGYPVLPGIFVVLALALLVSTFRDNLHDSLLGLGVILLGTPFYYWWAARKRRGESTAGMAG